MTDNLLKSAIASRRQTVFGTSVLMAGFSIATLCFCRVIFLQTTPESIFSNQQQESMFFDLFGFISASWLLCWVSTLNTWNIAAKLGQWIGLICLCVDQVSLIGIWRAMIESGSFMRGLWLAPAFLQVYLIGSFFGFFTLPGLTRDGNRTLTALGTLALLLPWLIARDEIVEGLQHLHGLFC